MEIVVAVVGGLIVTGFAGVMVMSQRGQAQAFIDACEGDDECEYVDVGIGYISAKTHWRRDGRMIEIRAGSHGSGKQRITVWNAEGHDVALGRRTTFEIGHEDVLSRAASVVGRKDIQVGDKVVDDALKIRGDDEDLVRGILLHPAVRPPLVAPCGEQGAFIDQRMRLRLEGNGDVTFRVRRSGLQYVDVRDLADKMFALVDGLHAAAEVSPVRVRLEGGLGGASGAPIGVSVIKDRAPR